MPIEFLCSGCSNTLRVPDEHAGKHARCPQCSSVNSIPSHSQPEDASPQADLFGPSTGQTTGPVGGSNQFNPSASNPYSDPVRSSDSRSAPQGQFGGNPYSTPHSSETRRAHYPPHRGGIILALGIFSFFCDCLFIPGILAWSLGAADLREIKAGRMDPDGHGLTTAGMILGIITTCLYGMIFLFYFGIFILGVVAAAN